MVLIHKYFDGITPERGELNEIDLSAIKEISIYPEKIGRSIESYRFREALNEAMNLARLGNKYLTECEPWKTIKTDMERTKTSLSISLEICANLSILLEPFMPFTTKKIQDMLNINSLSWEDAGGVNLIEKAHKLNTPELLFERIEDEEIQKQIDKLLSTKKANEVENAVASPQKENISFEDFAKMDIRSARIIEAEKLPKTKKLLKLKVDTGIDTRIIVSGIAEYYEPEEIIGKMVSVLVNLSPKNLKGIESQGMILMAEDKSGKLGFVSPTEDINTGSEIK